MRKPRMFAESLSHLSGDALAVADLLKEATTISEVKKIKEMSKEDDFLHAVVSLNREGYMLERDVLQLAENIRARKWGSRNPPQPTAAKLIVDTRSGMVVGRV